MIAKQFAPGELESVENVLARSDFLIAVEDLIRRGVDCIDAILTVCERRNLEPDSIVNFIRQNKAFKEKLFAEARQLHMVREDGRKRRRTITRHTG